MQYIALNKRKRNIEKAERYKNHFRLINFLEKKKNRIIERKDEKQTIIINLHTNL